MSLTEKKSLALTNGTAEVEVVGSPTAGVRRVVRCLSVYNADTAEATVTVRVNDGTNSYLICKVAIQPEETLTAIGPSGYIDMVGLDSTSDKLEVVLAGAVSANELHCVAFFAEIE